MRKIIIDTDIGNGVCGANTDDGLALALALASKNLDLLAITTLSGNVINKTAFCVARDLLKSLNLEIPVYLGASQALLEDMKAWRNRLDESVKKHNLEYLWKEKKEFQFSENISLDAPLKLCELARKYKNKLTICAIGPLTNIALAMTLDSEFASNLEELVIMGGVFDMPKYPKDTNFGFDPEAAKIVLLSDAKITLAPYNVTMQTSLQQSDLEDIKANNNTLCDWLYETINPWITYAELTRGSVGTWIHDALTVAYLIDESLFTYEKCGVSVGLLGEFRGASKKIASELKMDIGISPAKEVKILNSINNEALLKLIKTLLKDYK